MERAPTRGLRAPRPVLDVVRTLESAGFETWAVGGAIRDRLLGLPGGDWDLATRARPRDVQRLFRRTIPVGVDHGTVGVLAPGGSMIEVTTFRRDVVPLGRRALVEFADSIEDDLGRRDFTLNALAWHPVRDEVRDPFSGLRDLEQGVLRAVGDPDQRLVEDHLRILRGLRFAGRFSLRIEPATWEALVRRREQTRDLSAERVREELTKVVAQDRRPSRALGLYRASGVLGVLFAEIESAFSEAEPDAWTWALATSDRLSLRDPTVRLVPLLHAVATWGGPASVAVLLRRLRFSNAQMDRLVHLSAAWIPFPAPEADGPALRRWLHRGGAECRALMGLELAAARARQDGVGADVSPVVRVWRALRGEARRRPPLTVGDLAIDGRDLIRHGLRPGPEFGVLLDRLLAEVIEDPSANRPERLLARVEQWTTGDA
ncbi:MAG: tRNA cytidylyltransferase [Gemmatimonadota bacterium]